MTDPALLERQFETRQCPECGALTDRFEHCAKRGHPLIPQTDTAVDTVPVLVQVVDYLCHPRQWTDPERRARECSRGTKRCEVDHAG